MKKALISLVFLIISGIIYGQKPEIEFEEVYDENGAGIYNLYKIEQDTYGFIWFTDWTNGIYRYDGYKTIQYHYNPLDSFSLSYNYKPDIFSDKHSLLISSDDAVTDLYSTGNNTSYYQTLIDKQVLFDKVIKDKNGNLWILRQGSLYTYYKKEDRIVLQNKQYSEDLMRLINSYKKMDEIKSITGVGNNTDTSVSFKLNTDQDVMLVCSGEVNPFDKLYDYGMLLQGEDTVWKMSAFNTLSIDGHRNFRLSVANIHLKKGEYRLVYYTDSDVSSSNFQKEVSDYISFYGVKIFRNNKIKEITYVDNPGFDYVLNIFKNNQDDICVLTLKGIYTFRNNKFEFRSLQIDDTYDKESLEIIEIIIDDKNTIWYTSDIGTYRIREDSDTPEKITEGMSFLLYDKSRKLIWFGHESLYAYDLKTDEIYEWSPKLFGLKLKDRELYRIIDMYCDSSGSLFISTTHGVFKSVHKLLKSYVYSKNRFSGELRSTVFENGLFYFIDVKASDNNSLVLKVMDLNTNKTTIYDLKIQYSDFYEIGIYLDADLLYFYKDDNLYQYDIKRSSVTGNLKSPGTILKIFKDSENKIRMINHNSISIVDLKQMSVIETHNCPFNFEEDFDLDLLSAYKNYVIDYIVETKGLIYFRTYKDVYEFDKNTGVCSKIVEFPMTNYFEDPYMGNIIIDHEVIRFAAQNQIYSYNFKNKTLDSLCFYNYSKAFNNLNLLKIEDVLWMSSSCGLFRIDLPEKKIKYYGFNEGLFDLIIMDLTPDKNGNLWFTTQGALTKFNPVEEQFRHYIMVKDYHHNYFFHNQTDSIFKYKGLLGFFGTEAIIAFNPDELKTNVPDIYITKLKINNKEFVSDTVIHLKKEIQLSYDMNFIEIEFTAPDFTSPEQNTYAYILEGVDYDWNYTDYIDPKAKYTDLDPGTYVFRVKVLNDNGIWNEGEYPMIIKISPPFWKTWWFYILEGIFGLMVIFLIFKWRIRKLKKDKEKLEQTVAERTIELKERNIEIEAQKDEIEAQKDEIEAQRDTVLEQKEKIEEIHQHISDSIDYATRIQTSILPNETILKEFFSDHFVYYLPKDKVSGDFYWWSHIEGHTVITAADCTGHGVPGAFMSMLGVSFLREIVNKEYITHPGVILRRLRKEIVAALRQKGGETGSQDGMDMALISINHDTKRMQFAGANNPIYLIRKDELIHDDEKIVQVDLNGKKNAYLFYEIKPDRMPIAIYLKMDKFTTHEIKLKKGDRIYLFSDGFADQFGGPQESKLKYKQFKEILFENTDKPMAEQKTILEKAFNDWKGDIEQVDDVVVLGIKI